MSDDVKTSNPTVPKETVKAISLKTRWPSAHNSDAACEWKFPRLARIQRLVDSAMGQVTCCEEHRYRAALHAFTRELNPHDLGSEWFEYMTPWSATSTGLYALYFEAVGPNAVADVRPVYRCIGDADGGSGPYAWAHEQTEYEAGLLIERLEKATAENWKSEIATATAVFNARKEWVENLKCEHIWGFIGGDPKNTGGDA